MSDTVIDDHHRHQHNDSDFDTFAAAVAARFAVFGQTPLFTTDAPDLYAVYLDNLPPDQRQHHTCRCCQHFIQRYGHLVSIAGDGNADSVMWPSDFNHPIYGAANAALHRAVKRAKVTGVYLSRDQTWGTPENRDKDGTRWTHFAVKAYAVHRDRLKTAGQVMAEKAEDFGMLSRALADFPAELVDKAIALLKAEALYRGEKVLGVAEWLQRLHAARAAAKGAVARNVTWLAVATAPPGFTHVRSSMIGTLLEDLAAGLSAEDASRKFAAKMHPLQYQRPQAAPTASNIAEAERIVEKLGIARSLERRLARLDEVLPFAIWRPASRPESEAAGGVFAHLKARGAMLSDAVAINGGNITWAKFAATVLPGAEAIDLQAPSFGAYISIVTAVHADAPPILQWDREDERHTFSHYFWHGGANATQFGLQPNAWVRVVGVTSKPPFINQAPHYGQGAVLLLEGAADTRLSGHLALFPELMRSELREIRSTLEAFSRAGTMGEAGAPAAAGIGIAPQSQASPMIRVKTAAAVTTYKIDRWD